MIEVSGGLSTVTAQAQAAAHSGEERRSAFFAGLAAILFGGFLIAGAGFAGPEALHAAAHDARHAMGFPCH